MMPESRDSRVRVRLLRLWLECPLPFGAFLFTCNSACHRWVFRDLQRVLSLPTVYYYPVSGQNATWSFLLQRKPLPWCSSILLILRLFLNAAGDGPMQCVPARLARCAHGHLGDQLPGDVSGCSFILLCGHAFPQSMVTVSLSSSQHRACLLPCRCRQDGSTGIGKDCTTCYTQTLVLPALGAHAHAR